MQLEREGWRALTNQPAFDAWADAHPRGRIAIGVLFGLLAVCCAFAIAVMGPRLVREGGLLWFGDYAEGVVHDLSLVEDGRFRHGRLRYRLTIDYGFRAADGTAQSGRTVRTDVQTPPEFGPGDPIGVYYDGANPANSVAEHNLRTDVYALVLFLPFLSTIGFGASGLYLVQWRRWRRARRASARL